MQICEYGLAAETIVEQELKLKETAGGELGFIGLL